MKIGKINKTYQLILGKQSQCKINLVTSSSSELCTKKGYCWSSRWEISGLWGVAKTNPTSKVCSGSRDRSIQSLNESLTNINISKESGRVSTKNVPANSLRNRSLIHGVCRISAGPFSQGAHDDIIVDDVYMLDIF